MTKSEFIHTSRSARLQSAGEKFFTIYPEHDAIRFFSAPGRTEIGGNHTDHNNGRCLAGAVNLDTIACVEKTDDNTIVVDSEGFPPITVKGSPLLPLFLHLATGVAKGVITAQSRSGLPDLAR